MFYNYLMFPISVFYLYYRGLIGLYNIENVWYDLQFKRKENLSYIRIRHNFIVLSYDSLVLTIFSTQQFYFFLICNAIWKSLATHAYALSSIPFLIKKCNSKVLHMVQI